jgi:hypothetical protein
MFDHNHPTALSGTCYNIARALQAARRILNEEGDDADRRAEAVAILSLAQQAADGTAEALDPVIQASDRVVPLHR